MKEEYQDGTRVFGVQRVPLGDEPKEFEMVRKEQPCCKEFKQRVRDAINKLPFAKVGENGTWDIDGMKQAFREELGLERYFNKHIRRVFGMEIKTDSKLKNNEFRLEGK